MMHKVILWWSSNYDWIIIIIDNAAAISGKFNADAVAAKSVADATTLSRTLSHSKINWHVMFIYSMIL